MSDSKYFLKLIIDRDDEDDRNEWLPALDRPAAVRMLGLSAIATMVGCASSSTTAATSTSTTGTSTATTATTLTPSATSAGTGASVTLTASVSPSTATGSVTFYNGSTSLGSVSLSAGKASLSTSFSSAGTESLKAVYAGDSTYAASTSSTVTVTVTGATSACTQTLEGEEGPYFVNDSASGYFRSSILSNLDGTSTQTGVPFALTLYVYDGKSSCAPMQT